MMYWIAYTLYRHDTGQPLFTFGRSYGFRALGNSRKHPLPFVFGSQAFRIKQSTTTTVTNIWALPPAPHHYVSELKEKQKPKPSKVTFSVLEIDLGTGLFLAPLSAVEGFFLYIFPSYNGSSPVPWILQDSLCSSNILSLFIHRGIGTG